jgi:Homoserine acetyltransferase
MNLNFSSIKKIKIEKPLLLDCGVTLSGFNLAYETYGKLNEKKIMQF